MSEPKPRVEDHIVGLRQWQVVTFAGLDAETIIQKMHSMIASEGKPLLGSVTGRSSWIPGEWKTAECEMYAGFPTGAHGYGSSMSTAMTGSVFAPNPKHVAPVRAHECGCYAYHPDQIWPAIVEPVAPYIWGVVQAKGKVCVHHQGFRAQHARMVALIAEPTPFWALMAECMGVDLLPQADARDGWAPYGTLVDPAHRPVPPEGAPSPHSYMGRPTYGTGWHGSWSTQGWGPPLSHGQRAAKRAYGQGGYYAKRAVHLQTLHNPKSTAADRAAALRKMRSEREDSANAMRKALDSYGQISSTNSGVIGRFWNWFVG